ncbi:MAG: DUF1254 domain-containing protein [Bacteroidales bacterium]
MAPKLFPRIVVLILTISVTFLSCKKEKPLSNEEISAIVTEAYIYAYPLITMKITADKATNVVHANDRGFAPFNQFSHRHTMPDHNFTMVVSPNVDTFYSSAFLDLENGPMVLSVPDATLFKPEGEPWRYYLMQLTDAWSNVFAAPGVRTTGTGPGLFLISGPDWSGQVPAGMIHYPSPTNLVWVIGRTIVKDPADIQTVIAFQNSLALMPLSAWPGPYDPPSGTYDASIDMVTPPVAMVANLDVETYFQLLCDLMVQSPAASYDGAMVDDLAKLGITPGAEFSLSDFTESEQDAIKGGFAAGQAKMSTLGTTVQGNNRNGWKYLLQGIGTYGDQYNTRAYVAMIGLGANLPEDAVYPSADVDIANQPLNNSNNYTITFPAGQTPPAQGFWSITMYDKNNFLVYSPILRYALGSYSGLVPNEDGSVTLYLQKDSPGIDKESNWLPTPQDDNSPFNLKMRIYWPGPTVLNDQWEVPGIVKVN